MGTFLCYAYGYHCKGHPNFAHTGFALFTDSKRSLMWMRTGGEPLMGKIIPSEDEEHTVDMQALIVSGQAKMRQQFEIQHPFGFSELRAEAFGFSGANLNDFSSLSFPNFKDFSKHIGMPEDVLPKAAKHILRIYR